MNYPLLLTEGRSVTLTWADIPM